jgi:RNA polymerase sigma-70 factor (ECF subfamily)
LLSPGEEGDAPVLEPASSEPGPEDEAIIGQLSARLRGAVAQLSPNQRAALLLQANEGLTSREIAAVLNCAENTARVHVHRAIVQLKKALKRDD